MSEDKLMPKNVVEAMASINAEAEKLTEIPLSEFVNDYLPLLASREGASNIAPYVKRIGSPFSEVLVTDGGMVVYRLPPLLHTQTTTVSADYEDSLTSVTTVAEQKKNIHPMSGLVHLQNGFRSKMDQPVLVLDEVERWNKVLTDYGYEPIDLGIDMSGVTDETAQEAPSLLADDYEEL